MTHLREAVKAYGPHPALTEVFITCREKGSSHDLVA
jgi:hypothetical protein